MDTTDLILDTTAVEPMGSLVLPRKAKRQISKKAQVERDIEYQKCMHKITRNCTFLHCIYPLARVRIC